MKDDFLSYYRSNLIHLRQMSGEFAQQFPKIAAKLNLKSDDVQDPFVERLLEGTSFIAAKVEQKFDEQNSQFLQQVLHKVCPLATTPVPAAAVVSMKGSLYEAESGSISYNNQFEVANQASSRKIRFSPLWDTRIYNFSVTSAEYLTSLVDVLPNESVDINAALKITCTGCDRIHSSGLAEDENVDLFLSCDATFASRLASNLINDLKAVYVQDEKGVRKVEGIHFGLKVLDTEKNLLSEVLGSLHGASSLHLFMSYPFILHFVTAYGLVDFLKKQNKPNVSLIFAFSKNYELQKAVNREVIRTACVPLINLFKSRSSRTTIDIRHQYIVDGDRADPLGVEVFSIDSLEIFDRHNELVATAYPFYSFKNELVNEKEVIFFGIDRRERMQGIYRKRSNYKKTDTFVSIAGAVYGSDHEEFSEFAANIWCTNGDLPIFIGRNAPFSLVDGSFETPTLTTVTRPHEPLFMQLKQDAFDMLAYCIMNISAFLYQKPETIKSILQNIMQTFYMGSVDEKKLFMSSVSDVRVKPNVFRFVRLGYVYYERGYEMDLTLDEKGLTGMGEFFVGSVIEQLIADYSPLNLMVKVNLYSKDRGFVCTWNRTQD
ncbi:MAG: type VI secretion system baseplate subunit TssF [Succinivibrio sp.]|nr:type VI secretion system baseplate subunit TssF [Succinivibrio sp.]